MYFSETRMRSYCIANDLCTRMDAMQYDTLLQEAGAGNLTVTEAALLLKFCSETEKTRDEITVDLIETVRGG